MPATLQKILQKIKTDSTVVELQGLSGSSKALVVSMLSQIPEQPAEKIKPLVVVCESFDVAEVLLNDLYYFFGKEGVHFFPFWDVLPFDNFSPHKGLVAQRFKTLDALLNSEVRVLITTPNGMMQRFLPRVAFQKNTLSLSTDFVGGKQELRQQLLNSGYIQVDVVEDQGEFSAHGDIMDVFPLNQEKPVRMEFSENSELLYLKPFEIQTQRTAEAELTSLKILPGSEILFNQETIYFARQTLPSYRKECTPEVLRRLKESLQKSESFPGIESLSPLFYPKLETLFDYFPAEYLLVVDEENHITERAEHFYQEVFMEYELSSQQNKLTLSPEALFLTHRELESRLKESTQVYLKSKVPGKKSERTIYQLQFSDNQSLRTGFEHSNATSAAGHMVQLLQDWSKSGIPIILSAKNQTHAEHFQQLLEDLGVESIVAGKQQVAKDCPWPKWLESNTVDGLKEKIPILCGNVSSGFRRLDADGQTQFILLTQEEVFGEKKRSRRLQRYSSSAGNRKFG